MSRVLNKLTERRCDTFEEPGRYADGGGLYLQVRKATTYVTESGEKRVVGAGTKSWLFRFSTGQTKTSRDGKPYPEIKEIGLGPYPTITLKRAREKAAEMRRQVAEGEQPKPKRVRRAEAALEAAKAKTFKQCAEEFVRSKKVEWRNAKHREQWTATLETYAFPTIGHLPVGGIDTALVKQVLEPIWNQKPETAGRLRGRIKRILDYAKTSGYRTGENPAEWRGRLEHLLSNRKKAHLVRHHSAMPYRDVPAFMAELREREGRSARALEFTILTAARTGETIGATWPEFDLEEKIWTIPGERMKSGKEHRVPLSARAVRILQEAKSEGLTPGPFGALSNMAMLELIRGMRGRGSTVHGFRSSFRDWCAEQTNFPREIAEAALAHVVGGVEGAYQRGDYFEKRSRLMKAWDDFLAQPKPGKVVPIRA